MKKLIEEFKKFIMRGNVLDMAIGVVIATAFGKITSSLVNDVFMPFISWIFGTRDMTALNLVVREATETQEAIVIGFGSFIAVVIDFILVAFVVFLVVKFFNKARELAHKKEEEVKEEAPAAPTTEELLGEILEELKKQNGK